MIQAGKILIGIGILLVLSGVLMANNHLSWLGKLPGDWFFRKGNFSFYFPLTTCILLSVLVTVFLSFFRK